MSNIEKAQAAREVNVLNKLTRYNGKDMTRKAFVEILIQIEHGKPYTYQESRIKPMTSKAFFRATKEEQDRHERLMKIAGMKICYAIKMPDETFFDVPKTAYDYACTLYCDELAKEE